MHHQAGVHSEISLKWNFGIVC